MKKLAAIILSVLLCFCVSACGNKGGSGNGNENNGGIGGEQGDNENNGDENGGDEEESVADKLDDLVKSFWHGDTMYEETILLVAETDADGNVVSAPKAKLMFDATEIVSLKQYNVSAKVPEKTHDSAAYTYKDGYIIATGNAEGTTFNTVLPYVNDKALTGEQAFPGVPQNTSIPSKVEGLYLPFTEGVGIVNKQLYVTYKHDEVSTNVMPEYQSKTLSKTLSKLKSEEDINMLIYGDSISTGANSSSILQIEPELDPWYKLVQKNLAKCYGGKVTLKNFAVGGWTSTQGVNGGTVGSTPRPGLKGLFLDANYLKGYSPDLAIIGFGMNDATLNVGIAKYKENTKSMIDSIRSQNPNCDIILLGTMLANPASPTHAKNQAEYSESLNEVAAAYGGVAVIDVGKIHKVILDSGKNYTSVSANNVNHPNDFTTRMYATAILAALVK